MFSKIFDHIEGESEQGLSYPEVVKRGDKQGRAYFVSTVSWDEAPQALVELETKHLGTLKIFKSVKLPQGYKMQAHDHYPTWLGDLMSVEQLSMLSFAEIDELILDCRMLREQHVDDFEYFDFIYQHRDDYQQYSFSFANAWDAAFEFLSAKLEQAKEVVLPH